MNACSPSSTASKIATTLLGDKKGEVLAEAGAAMTEELLMALPVKKLADLFQSKEVNENVGELLVQYDHQNRVHQVDLRLQARKGHRKGTICPPA